MFYLAVPLFVWLFRRTHRTSVLATTYVLSVGYKLLCTSLAERYSSPVFLELARQLPGQMSYFAGGAVCYYSFGFFERHWAALGVVSAIVLMVNRFWSLPILEPLALSVVTITISVLHPLPRSGRHEDFSYGTYIVHFPVWQLLLHSGWFIDRPWRFFFVGTSLTGVLAIVLWYSIERPFLRPNRRRLAFTEPQAP